MSTVQSNLDITNLDLRKICDLRNFLPLTNFSLHSKSQYKKFFEKSSTDIRNFLAKFPFFCKIFLSIFAKISLFWQNFSLYFCKISLFWQNFPIFLSNLNKKTIVHNNKTIRQWTLFLTKFYFTIFWWKWRQEKWEEQVLQHQGEDPVNRVDSVIKSNIKLWFLLFSVILWRLFPEYQYKKNLDIRNCLPLTNNFLISRFNCTSFEGHCACFLHAPPPWTTQFLFWQISPRGQSALVRQEGSEEESQGREERSFSFIRPRTALWGNHAPFCRIRFKKWGSDRAARLFPKWNNPYLAPSLFCILAKKLRMKAWFSLSLALFVFRLFCRQSGSPGAVRY